MRLQIGEVTCPFNGCTGKVYRETAGKVKGLYYRCDCGCIQIRTPKGQAWMAANVRMFTGADTEKRQEAVAAVVAEAKEVQRAEARQAVQAEVKTKGLFSAIDSIFEGLTK